MNLTSKRLEFLKSDIGEIYIDGGVRIHGDSLRNAKKFSDMFLEDIKEGWENYNDSGEVSLYWVYEREYNIFIRFLSEEEGYKDEIVWAYSTKGLPRNFTGEGVVSDISSYEGKTLISLLKEHFSKDKK
jgi:hypothetical protein